MFGDVWCWGGGFRKSNNARLMTDLLLEKVLGRPRFSWGGAKLENQGEVRDAYIRALRTADRQDYTPLLAFVRS